MATTATTPTYGVPYPLGVDSLSNVAIRIQTLAEYIDSTYTSLGVSLNPASAPILTGDAVGGTLSGLYPNPIIPTGAITSNMILEGTILNADVNASAGIVYSKLTLTGNILNADVNTSAAIAYSKLNLGTSIVNTDVSTSAAIAYSKLNLTGSILTADIAAANVTGAKIESSVALAGSPTTTTQSSSDNSTKIATTAYVSGAVTGVTLATLGFPITKTADFTVGASENWLISNKSSSCVVTLPSAAVARVIWIKNIAAFTVVSASSNVKPIGTNTAGTAILPATAGTWCTLVSDGTNWIVMQSGPGLFS